MRAIFGEIIIALDRKLYAFYNSFVEHTINFESQFKLKPNFYFERTLSNECKIFLDSIFDANDINVLFSLSEFSLQGIEFSTTLKKQLKSEVSISKEIKEAWRKMYVDNYFKVKINDNVKHIFIEYKLNDEINYFDLAKDFLKYKIFNYFNELDDTIFIYFVLNKENGKYPTIINENFLYNELKSIIDDNVINDNIRVYFYEDGTEPKRLIRMKEDIVFQINIFDCLEKIINKIEQIDFNKVVFKSDNIFVCNKNILHNNVFEALIIKKNYKVIKKLTINSNFNTINDQTFFEDIAPIFSEIQISVLGELHDEAKNGGLHTRFRPSLFIITLLCYYDMYILDSSKRNFLEVLNCNDTDKSIIEKNVEKIKNNVDNGDCIIEDIFFEKLIFLIKNLYIELFEIDIYDNVVKYKDKYNDAFKELNILTRELNRILGIQNKGDFAALEDLLKYSVKVLKLIVSDYYKK